MLKAAEYIEPEWRPPYLHGALTIAVIVPAALLGSLIFASLFMDADAIDPSVSDLQIYGP